MLRRAQFTAFLTKLRGSSAHASMSGRKASRRSSVAALSCTASAAIMAKAARRTNSSSRAAHSRALSYASARLVEQVRGELVADVPRVEVGDPRLHLRLVDESRVVDDRRQQARLVVARRPQGERELVVAAEGLRHPPQLPERDPEGVVDPDAVARHAGAVLLAALRGELAEKGGDAIRDGRRRRGVRHAAQRRRRPSTAMAATTANAIPKAAPSAAAPVGLRSTLAPSSNCA